MTHTVICVVRLDVGPVHGAPAHQAAQPWTQAFVGRYMNCYRGSTDTNYHAEQFLLEVSQY